MYNITGFPTAYIDRNNTWNYPEPNNINQALEAAEGTVDVGLAIESSLNGFYFRHYYSPRISSKHDKCKITCIYFRRWNYSKSILIIPVIMEDQVP